MQRVYYWAIIAVFFLPNVSANVSWSVIEQNLRKVDGDLKALSHIQCFYDQLKSKRFPLKEPNFSGDTNRCFNIESVSLEDQRFFTLIDYTKPGTKSRMYLVDRVTGNVKNMGVAHGRYKSSYVRMFSKPLKNSVKWARYFSNTPGSNAPSSGFFFAGQEYEGKFGRSLVLHGIEEGINDNACERAVVIHKHLMVSKKRAYVMSSGCPMVSYSNINPVIDAMKGKQDGIGLTEAGGLVFVYGPREKIWQYGSCPL